MTGVRQSVLVALFVGVAALAAAEPQAAAAPQDARVPRVVRFDGVFVPADGQAPAAVETVALAVYAGATGGAPLWEETQTVRVDAQGRYAVLLGATSAEGLPPSVLAAADARWLEVRFARMGEAGQPRVLLTSVPYALRAADADTLGGLPASAFLRAPENAGTAAGDSATDGSATGGRAIGPAVNTGTANYIGKFTNAIDLTSSAIYENAGRIGIGVTTPLDFLHSRFTDASGTLTGIAVQNMSNSASAYSGMLFYDETGALGQFQGFNNATHEYRIHNIATGATINFMLRGWSQFFVKQAADQINPMIGLGTTLPTDTLHVATGFVRSRQGIRMVSGGDAWSSGLSLESDVLNLGVNDGFTGPFNLGTGFQSGYFRIDPRLDQPLFSWRHKAASSGNDTIRMQMTASGVLTAPGVRSNTVTSSPVAVMVDASGQLGIVTSSRRYKDDIEDMGEVSSGLMRLRPVTFRYKQDAGAGTDRPTEYGLIAEEVEAAYPDLVAHLANGDVETVQYHKINAMLLNEVQKQHRQIGAQQDEIAGQRAALTAATRELDAVKARLAELERFLTATRR
ncbi:MAG: tail fiber domain-containing protein [Acidobacteria bacterium]|nr:tail fiber domain-containing protein [Acidobacteriota bacterium]